MPGKFPHFTTLNAIHWTAHFDPINDTQNLWNRTRNHIAAKWPSMSDGSLWTHYVDLSVADKLSSILARQSVTVLMWCMRFTRKAFIDYAGTMSKEVLWIFALLCNGLNIVPSQVTGQCISLPVAQSGILSLKCLTFSMHFGVSLLCLLPCTRFPLFVNACQFRSTCISAAQ